jgi:uncharacterized protein (UPF0333 family)
MMEFHPRAVRAQSLLEYELMFAIVLVAISVAMLLFSGTLNLLYSAINSAVAAV